MSRTGIHGDWVLWFRCSLCQPLFCTVERRAMTDEVRFETQCCARTMTNHARSRQRLWGGCPDRRRTSRWRPTVGPQVLWLGCCPHRHLQASPTDRVGWRSQSSTRVTGLSENAEATRARGHGSVMTRFGGADKPLAWGSEPVPDQYSDVWPQSSVRQHRCRTRARDRALWSLLLGASRQQWSSP
jgi:hypothetical protein